MSNTDMQDALLRAIDIISTQKMNFAKYDKTIQGVILQCVDATIGKYKVRYQDSIFIAYSENTSAAYAKGTNVYILVPNSDMTKAKTIIGAVNRLGINFVQVYDLQEKYNLIGNNIVINNNSSPWGLCSFKKSQLLTLYDYERSANSLIQIDKKSVQEYLKQSDLLVVSMDVKTNLIESQRYLGNYGLVIQADFIDKTAQEQQVTRYFVLDIDNFTGNPYLYTTETQQKASFEIDGENFVRIRSINLFSRDFPNYTTAARPNDIFISGLKIQGGRAFTTDELNTSTLVLNTPRGYIFDESDAETATRTIQASVRIKGKKADVNSQGIEFYWFVQDASISTLSPLYMKDAGQGWRCLNEYNQVNDQLRQYLPASSIYTIQKKDVFVERVRYKCVAIYKDDKTIVLSKQLQMINYDAEYRIVIQSDLGTKFYKDNGTPTLTCRCFHRKKQSTEPENPQEPTDPTEPTGDDEPADSGEGGDSVDPSSGENQGESTDTEEEDWTGEREEEGEEIQYVWSMISSVGVFESLSIQSEEASTFYSVSKTLQINVAKIVNFATFKCAVFLPLNGTPTYIGTGSIVISNSAIDENSYYLIINNGTQLFKYSTTGLSPASSQLENPIQLKSLSFNLYNNEGEEVDVKLIEHSKITWTVPIKNSMLDIVTAYQQPADQDAVSSTIVDTQQIVYKIKDNYSSYYTNNQIELTVNYNGDVLKAKTDFTFLKEGESGTNGTEYTFRFVPDIVDGTKMPQYPTITFYNASNYVYNWSRINTAIGKAQLWHNGDLIYSSSNVSGKSTQNKDFSITDYQLLRNVYGGIDTQDRFMFYPSKSSYCTLNINDNLNLLNTDTFLTTPFAAILKTTAQYQGIDFISTMPICVAYLPEQNNTNKIFLKEGTGFNKVLYTSNGIRPMYDSRNPFEIQIIENGQTLTDAELVDFTFEWNCVGSVWSKIGSVWRQEFDQYLTIREKEGLKPNQALIRPANEITGECVTTAVVCKVTKNDTLFGFIYIPVHMLLNRYENSAINGWDGNTIDLGNENGGMILAPQMGAGVKEDDNSFTGIVMGTAKDPNETNSILGYDVGLFGYYKGKRSIFLDSRTGKAFFGVSGKGQVIIDPSQDAAILKSGNYSLGYKDATGADVPGQGMQINLTKPEIRYGNGNFIVNENGVLTAVGANIIGTLDIDKGGQIIAPTGGWNAEGLWLGANSFSNGKFKVTKDGSVTIRNGDIVMGDEDNPMIRINSSTGFTMRRGSISIGSGDDPSFRASSSGVIVRNGSIKLNRVTGSADDVDTDATIRYGIQLDRQGLRLGYNKDLPNLYNFEATSSGNVTVAKNFKLGYRLDNEGNGFYAVEIDNNGKIKLTSTGSDTRLQIDGNGIISFTDVINDSRANIQYGTQTIYVPPDAYVDSDGLEVPDFIAKTVNCLNFRALYLNLTGNVSILKELSTKRINNNGAIITKRLTGKSKLDVDGQTFLDFGSSSGVIGISGSKNAYNINTYGNLTISQGYITFYGRSKAGSNNGQRKGLFRVYDTINLNHMADGFPLVGDKVCRVTFGGYDWNNTAAPLRFEFYPDPSDYRSYPRTILTKQYVESQYVTKSFYVVNNVTFSGSTFTQTQSYLTFTGGLLTSVSTFN